MGKLPPIFTPVGFGKLYADKPTFMLPPRDGITQGTIGRWIACPEKCRLSMLDGWATSGSSMALDFGTAVHAILEKLYGWFRDASFVDRPVSVSDVQLKAAQLIEDYRRAANTELLTMMGSARAMEQLDQVCRMAQPVIYYYIDTYHTDFKSRTHWMDLERKFRVDYPLDAGILSGGNYSGEMVSVPLVGMIDGIYTVGDDQRTWLLETKTKSNIDDEESAGRLTFDLQTGFYLLAAELYYGSRPQGVTYNIIRRPQLRQKQTETYDEFVKRIADDIQTDRMKYFMRYQITYSDDELAQFRKELNDMIVGWLRWYCGAGPHFRNTQECKRMYMKCEFLRYCGTGVDETLVRRPHVHPELER